MERIIFVDRLLTKYIDCFEIHDPRYPPCVFSIFRWINTWRDFEFIANIRNALIHIRVSVSPVASRLTVKYDAILIRHKLRIKSGVYVFDYITPHSKIESTLQIRVHILVVTQYVYGSEKKDCVCNSYFDRILFGIFVKIISAGA